LRPILARHGIDRTILVQAAPTVAETRFLLEIAGRTNFVGGVVGWIDFAAPDAPEAIASLANEAKLVGLRPMVQDIPDDDWLAQPHLAPAFEAMVRADLVFDALVLPLHLSRLLGVLERHPALRVVVDHGAKPEIRARRFDDWARDMRRIAEAPNVFCKLSGLATEASEEWTVATLLPYVDHLLAVFGPARLIWGSDWPVVELAGGYERWRAATEQLLAPLRPEERAAILGETAQRVYRLGA
jgi:L-fuconolactonase